jgi:hypothetical protein
VKHKSSTPLDFYCRCKREETRTLLAGFVARNKFALWDNDDDAGKHAIHIIVFSFLIF